VLFLHLLHVVLLLLLFPVGLRLTDVPHLKLEPKEYLLAIPSFPDFLSRLEPAIIFLNHKNGVLPLSLFRDLSSFLQPSLFFVLLEVQFLQMFGKVSP
jgi:hypothetical protein